MSDVLFISDPHFFHKNICKFRKQFESVDQHNHHVMERILSKGGKRNSLWIMGDSMLINDMEEWHEAFTMLLMIAEVYGSVKFILGNHCTDRPLREKFVQRVIAPNFEIHSLVKYKEFWLSHAPIHESELRGRFNIYGHTHSEKVDDNRYIPVSCEHIDYTPISLTEIRKKLEN